MQIIANYSNLLVKEAITIILLTLLHFFTKGADMPKEWSDRYSLNHPKIDAQHKELFRLANCVEALDAHKVTKEELSELLKEFFNYMREHFKDEEAYMQSIDYPLLKDHQALHEHIIISMTMILKETKGIEALQAKIKTVSHQWLVEHILENDQKIEKWRRGNMVDLDIMTLPER